MVTRRPYLAVIPILVLMAQPVLAGSEGRLMRAHERNVAESIERYIASGQMSSAHAFAASQGLASFREARAQGLSLDVVDPQLPDALIDLSEDPGLLEVMAQPQTSGKLQADPSGVFAVGSLRCFYGDQLLVNGRFIVTVTYQGFVGGPTRAYACALTPSSGYFFFGDPTNVEIPMKVLNACSWGNPPGHWVFAAGLTNFGIALTVLDGYTGISRTYVTTLGQTFNTIIDQQTPFPCP